MSVQQNYCRTVACELRRYAVWQPGGALVLGDYGTLDGNSFQRLGHISEFIDAALVTVEVSSSSALEFTSAGTKVAMLRGEGAAAAGPVKAQARLRIGFSREDAIYLRASRVETSDISNLRVVTEALRGVPDWKFDWTIVGNLSVAGRLSVILSMGANTEVSVLAEAPALEAFNLGTAEGSAGLTIVGEAALKMVGAKGPVLFDLVRLRRLLGGIKKAAVPGGLALLPFERVVPDGS